MTIQVTLHLKYNGDNPSVQEAASMHRIAEEWARTVVYRNSLSSIFKMELIDVFRVDTVRDYLDTSKENPF